MSTVKFAPSDIETTFPTSPDDMPKIATATERPNRTSLLKFQDRINANAMAIPSSANGTLGHLGLVIGATKYHSVSNNVAFVVPNDPGSNPTHANGATAAQISETNRQHDRDVNIYQVFVNTRTQLRNMIIKNVPDEYISPLKHEITQYNQVSPLDLLDHLWTTYGDITSKDLSANEKRMTADWNPPTPIETLYKRMKEGKIYAQQGGENISNATLVRWSYEIIEHTGLFEHDLKEWRDKPEASKTWTHFQTFFAKRDDDRRKNTTTTKSAGYSANEVQELVQKEMANLLEQLIPEDERQCLPAPAPSPAPPNTSPSDAANAASVTMENIEKSMKGMIEDFMKKTADGGGGGGGGKGRNGRDKKPLIAQGYDDSGTPITYCWSHGITKNLRHTSKTCSRKKEGHKDDATLNNKMGGSTERCKTRDRSGDS